MSSAYTVTFPTSDIGIFTFIDVDNVPVAGVVTAFAVGQLTTRTLTVRDPAAASVVAVAACRVVPGAAGRVVLQAAAEATTMQSPTRSKGPLAPTTNQRRESGNLTGEHDIGGA
jgi:hypothetical protein